MNRRAYPKVRTCLLPDGDWIPVCGREAETLIRLEEKRKSDEGLSAYDFAGGPPFRLGAYVFELRRLGFPIRTERAPHAGGSHAVYFLEAPVAIEVIRPPVADGPIAA